MIGLEKIVPLNIRNLRDREFIRALYYGAMGVVAVCATKAGRASNQVPAGALLALIVPLLFLSNYHLKFKEARQGIWFPHAVFHVGLQWLVLFPAGLSLLIQFFRRIA